ncbi:MAG: ABC transporter substrate-binding protein [Thiotrichales bacterium]|nr:ABC transporter substrate-binding protein [Thiotrichales bacterium]
MPLNEIDKVRTEGLSFSKRLFTRRTLVRSLSVLAPLAGANFLGGCSSTQSDETIRMAVNTRPQMLDPRRATDALSSRINRLLYRSLVDFNAHFEPVPDLADWQQVSPTHYRFRLRESSTFHHGGALEAKDIAATYQSVLDPKLGSAHRGALKNIEEITVVDTHTIDFTLKEVDALFVGRLVIGILPADLIENEHPFHLQPVGSGPCRFVAMSEQWLKLQRLNDQVLLEFVPVKEATVRVLKLLKGEIDLLQNDLSPELVAYCRQQNSLQVQFRSGTNFGYIGFNFADPLLQQTALRQALAHGIDRQAVIAAIFQGQARLAQGLLVPEHWCGLSDLPDYEYNPEKAKQLLKSVQVPAEHLTLNNKNQRVIKLSYKTSNDPTRIRLATIYQSQLRPLGIELKIQSYDWGTFYNDIKQGRFQLFSLAWVGVKSPDIFQYAFASNAIPPKGANRGRFMDAESDALIAQALHSPDLAEQAMLYRQLQRRLHSQLASLPLWYEDNYAVQTQRLSPYPLFTDGRFDGLLKVQKRAS